MTYKITDYNGEENQGSFYEQELQKTKQDIFTIEKIISNEEVRALSNGWAIMIRSNSWVNNKDINKL